MLLISTGHEDADILSPILPDIYNLQHCGVDIVNEMLKDYSSQPVSNGWTIVVCTFILDLPVINAQTVLIQNSEPHKHMSLQFY